MNNNVFCLETTKSHRQNCLPIMMLYRNESSGKKNSNFRILGDMWAIEGVYRENFSIYLIFFCIQNQK